MFCSGYKYMNIQNYRESSFLLLILLRPPSLHLLFQLLRVMNDKMMYLWVTDYIANTAAVVYQQAGILQVTVTPDMVIYSVLS